MKAKGEEMQSTNLHKSTQRFVEISEDLWRTEKGLGVSSQELGLAAKNAESAKPWPMVRLGDVCETLTDGDWIESKDQSYEGIRLIQTGNVGDGRFLKKENRARYISLDTFQKLKCTEIFPGDVLVSRLPEPVGRACIVEDIGLRMITAVDCSIIRFTKDVYAKYFVMFSQSPKYQESISFLVTGTTRARISRKNLSSIQIPLPPIEVQKEIVERLEKELGEADKVAAEFKRMAELADKEFKAELDETFGGLGNGEGEVSTNLHKSTQRFVEISEDLWRREKGLGVGIQELGLAAKNAKAWPMVRLGDVCERITKGTTPTSIGYQFVDEGVNFVKIESFNDDGIILPKKVTHITSDCHAALERSQLRSNDILFSIAGAIGRVVVVQESILPANTNQAFAIIRLRHYNEVDPLFMRFYLKSECVRTQYLPMQKTSAQTNLSLKNISDFLMVIPPIKVQKEIVAKLDAAKEKCEKLKAEAERGLRAAENLRKAILSEAFELN